MTKSHPSSMALEAFACGEDSPSVAAHVADCTACSSFAQRAKDAMGPFERTSDIEARVRKAIARVPSEGNVTVPAQNVVRLLRRASYAMPALAAAAGLVFWIRPGRVPTVISGVTPTAGVVAGNYGPGTTFKGGAQLAVIRLRGEGQERLTGAVRVRPGDRLRVEVALDHEEAILAGILTDAGEFTELMPEAARGTGTHFSEQAARVDHAPSPGWIVCGTRAQIDVVRATKSVTGLSAMRVEWEAP
jgi:hypothetical protein